MLSAGVYRCAEEGLFGVYQWDEGSTEGWILASNHCGWDVEARRGVWGASVGWYVVWCDLSGVDGDRSILHIGE